MCFLEAQMTVNSHSMSLLYFIDLDYATIDFHCCVCNRNGPSHMLEENRHLTHVPVTILTKRELKIFNHAILNKASR